MTKRLLSLAFALLFAVGIIPFGSINSVAAKDDNYSVSAALKYADKNWNNGVGLCAEFVSRCLQAGGVDIFEPTVINLYNALKGRYGDSYKLTLTNGTNGRVSMYANDGKLGEFKGGAMKIAMESGAKVVPVLIEGSRARLEETGNITSGTVYVTFLPPIETKGLEKEDFFKMPQQIRAMLQNERDKQNAEKQAEATSEIVE